MKYAKEDLVLISGLLILAIGLIVAIWSTQTAQIELIEERELGRNKIALADKKSELLLEMISQRRQVLNKICTLLLEARKDCREERISGALSLAEWIRNLNDIERSVLQAENQTKLITIEIKMQDSQELYKILDEVVKQRNSDMNK